MEMIKMSVMKELLRVLFLALFICCVGNGVYAQEVCDNTSELDELRSVYGDEEVRAIMWARYGDSLMHMPSPSAYRNLIPSTLGGTFREPTFGYEVKLVGKDIQQLNAERDHWNSSGKLAFFKTHSWKIGIFDGEKGDWLGEVAFSFTDFPQGSKNMDAIRWHPTDPNVVVYPRNNELRGRNVFTKADFLIESFNHGILGKGGRRMGGGDGNDFANNTNRLLLSATDKYKNVMVYDSTKGELLVPSVKGIPVLTPMGSSLLT